MTMPRTFLVLFAVAGLAASASSGKGPDRRYIEPRSGQAEPVAKFVQRPSQAGEVGCGRHAKSNLYFLTQFDRPGSRRPTRSVCAGNKRRPQCGQPADILPQGRISIGGFRGENLEGEAE